MDIIHFLDVGQGDCSVIQHRSGRITMIDVCNARNPSPYTAGILAMKNANHLIADPNYENPISYLHKFDIHEIFRFIATHPDMDHIDGISDIFDTFFPENFWYTDTNKKISKHSARFRQKDWETYKRLCTGTFREYDFTTPLALYSGSKGPYYNKSDIYGSPCDNLDVLAPTPNLIRIANHAKEYNDASYVVLFRTLGGKILFCGDSHDNTWDHLLCNHLSEIQDIKIMVAPHHGRSSGRNWEFLDCVKPKLTLFGRAPSQHLSYSAWNSRGLKYITKNQAGTTVVVSGIRGMHVFVANRKFAHSRNRKTFYEHNSGNWWYDTI